MAFNVEEFVQKKQKAKAGGFDIGAFVQARTQGVKKAGGFDVNEFLKEKGVKLKTDLDTSEGLEELAKQEGLEPPAKEKIFNALRKVGGVLNVGTAFTSGLVKGALDEKTSALGEAFSRVGKSFSGEEIKGFSDTARELGINPETRMGKIALGTGGFIADVVFDPLTYLSFGMGAGLKVGTKSLNKTGTKLFQEVATKATEQFGQKGIGKTRILFEQATGKKGLTEEAVKDFTEAGFDEATLKTLQEGGKELIDQGGIKFLGKSLVSSERLGKTVLGRAAKALGETEIVQAFKNTLGKTFVADFAKNPKLVSILDKANRQQRKAVETIIAQNEELFKGLSDKEMTDFFDVVFEKKSGIAGKEGAERTEAKLAQKAERLVFDNPKLQNVSDKLFEGEDSIINRYAKVAGLPEEEAIKFYIPSKFADKVALKDFFIGNRLSSPSLGFLKRFTGKKEGLIKDPFEAYSQGQIDVVTSRIKSNTINQTIKTFGKPLQELTEAEARKLGFKKFSREILGEGGKQKVEAWIPEAISDELGRFIEPTASTVDELARITGFDYATGLFKGYVTSLFLSFYIRNITSNQFQNALKIGVDVVNPAMQKQALDVALGRNLEGVITTKTGQKLTLKQIRKMVEKESDVLEEGAFGRAERMIEEGRERIRRGSNRPNLNPLSRENVVLRAGQRIGETADKQAKLISIISSLTEGKSIKEAVKIAEEATFNYRKLTDFERKIMRRIIPFYCVPEHSLALTNRGWKTVDELRVRDILLTYNLVKKEYEWQPVEEIAIFEHNQELVTWQNTRHKLMFTGEHRWVVNTQNILAKRDYGKRIYRYKRVQKVVKGNQLNKNHSILSVSKYKKQGRSLLTPEEARLLGWLLSDGYFRWKGNYCEAVIYQHPKKFLKEIIEVAGGKPRKPHPKSGVVCVPVKKDRIEKISKFLKRRKTTQDWIDVVCKLNRPALNAMYDAMYKGDGTIKGQKFFACQLEGVAKTFEVLATLLGYRVVRNNRGFYVSTIRTLKFAAGTTAREHYVGRVWCPRTKNGTWVMKQDKFITITGNTFARKNAELQIKALATKPGAVAAQLKAIKGAGEAVGEPVTEEDLKGLPDYVLKSLGIKAGAYAKDQYGRDTFITGFGLPIEEFMGRMSGRDGIISNVVSNILSQMNPLLKQPLESATKVDFFRGRPITDITDAKDLVSFLEVLPNSVEKEVKDLIQWSESEKKVFVGGKQVGTTKKYSANPFVLHFLRNMFTGRIQSTIGFLSSDEQSNWSKWTRLLTGVRAWSIDKEEQAFFKELERKEELQKYLIRMGVIKTFQKPFIPKK